MDTSEILWYKKCAENWDEALPVGNGRLGGMIFGGAAYEKIQLNEDSIWSGGERKRNNLSALPNLDKVRNLLLNEQIEEAEKIVMDAFCGTPCNQRHYMPLGNLNIETENLGEEISYKRSLDLKNAVNLTEFETSQGKFSREVIASNPDEVILVNYKTDCENGMDLKIYIDDGRDDYYDFLAPISDDTILYTGGMGGEKGISFASAFKVKHKGGVCEKFGISLVCKGVKEVTIAVSCRTNYRFENFKDKCLEDVEKAFEKDYEALKTQHISDYHKLYDRCSLSLVDNSDGKSAMPTNERILNIQNGGSDNKLIELYFNFGRYLMISGSREGTLPLNLQGIWNKDMWPAWGCKYTININTEMNYWGVEVANLSELHTPLFDLIEKMRPNGRETAKVMYNCNGFVCHHNTDLWGDTAPQDLWIPGTQWPMGAAWLCLHIWEHYQFTQDKEFLSEKFDTLKECAEFFVDFLIEDKQGRLVTCPSVSPENTYLTKIGTKGSVCVGPSMDSQILFELFSAVISAGEILDRDEEFCQQISYIRERLPKPEIGKYGQIMEWAEDYDEVEPGHRHISQLFALYPADMISPRKTPSLAKGAKATLERRLSHGGGHTGWSRAWIVNHWARLLDGEKVLENLNALISHSTNPNMFDSHPPFQIDGNFGGSAGIAEAVLQSHSGEIALIPALPKAWSEGSFENLKARGGFTVSAKWLDGKIVTASIVSENGGECRIVSENQLKITAGGEKVATTFADGATVFETVKGTKYDIA